MAAGELACYLLAVLGMRMGGLSMDAAVQAALREAVLQVLRRGKRGHVMAYEPIIYVINRG